MLNENQVVYREHQYGVHHYPKTPGHKFHVYFDEHGNQNVAIGTAKTIMGAKKVILLHKQKRGVLKESINDNIVHREERYLVKHYPERIDHTFHIHFKDDRGNGSHVGSAQTLQGAKNVILLHKHKRGVLLESVFPSFEKPHPLQHVFNAYFPIVADHAVKKNHARLAHQHDIATHHLGQMISHAERFGHEAKHFGYNPSAAKHMMINIADTIALSKMHHNHHNQGLKEKEEKLKTYYVRFHGSSRGQAINAPSKKHAYEKFASLHGTSSGSPYISHHNKRPNGWANEFADQPLHYQES